MTISEYKERFKNLFKEIEEEHGRCKTLKIIHGQEFDDGYGDPVIENIVVEINF